MIFPPSFASRKWPTMATRFKIDQTFLEREKSGHARHMYPVAPGIERDELGSEEETDYATTE